MAKLKPEAAAIVAAHLTLARATLLSGVIAGRVAGAPVDIGDDIMETLFTRYLAFASEIDPKSPEFGGVLDLTQSSILPE